MSQSESQGEILDLTGERDAYRDAYTRTQAFNFELAAKYARQSRALSQAAERQGEQAREIARLREQIGDADEALSMAATYRHQQTEEIASLRERVDRLAAACIVKERFMTSWRTTCLACVAVAHDDAPLVHREGCAVEDQRYDRLPSSGQP